MTLIIGFVLLQVNDSSLTPAPAARKQGSAPGAAMVSASRAGVAGGGKPAGGASCGSQMDSIYCQMAEVDALALKKKVRKKGVVLALGLHSFELWEFQPAVRAICDPHTQSVRQILTWVLCFIGLTTAGRGFEPRKLPQS